MTTSDKLVEIVNFALDNYRKELAKDQKQLARLESGKIRHLTKGASGLFDVDITAELAAERRERIALYELLIARYETDLKAP